MRGVTLTGEFYGQKAILEKLITVKPGQIFSRKVVLATRELLDKFLSSQGYAMAQVELVPDVDEQNNTVFITYQH